MLILVPARCYAQPWTCVLILNKEPPHSRLVVSAAHLVHDQVAQALLAPQSCHGVVLNTTAVGSVATLRAESTGTKLNLRQGAAGHSCEEVNDRR
jgi:hypothetical protein